jgi:hypothetical protein
MSQETIALVSARQLEKQIFDREGIHVILLCSSKTMFKAWPWQRATQDKHSLARFRDERLVPHLREGHSGKGVEFMIVKAPVEELTNVGWWKLGNLRRVIKDATKRLAA